MYIIFKIFYELIPAIVCAVLTIAILYVCHVTGFDSVFSSAFMGLLSILIGGACLVVGFIVQLIIGIKIYSKDPNP